MINKKLAKLTNMEEVVEAFRSLVGPSGESSHYGRFNESHLKEAAPFIQEQLLDTYYNKVTGFTINDIVEAVNTAKTLNTAEYLKANKLQECASFSEADAYKFNASLNENFAGTTQIASPTPVLNKGVTLYQYNGTVLPWLCNIFDLKGPKAIAYYIALNAVGAQGDVADGDLMASPRQLSKQSSVFAGTKVTNKEVGLTTQGSATITGTIDINPIVPRTLTLTVNGITTGALVDLTEQTYSGIITLTPQGTGFVAGAINLNTGEYTITLTSVAPNSTAKVLATFNRDVETKLGAVNIATVTPKFESVNLEARNYAIKVDSNIFQDKLVQSLFGMDLGDELDSLLSAIYNREIANSMLKDIVAEIPSASAITHALGGTYAGGDNAFFRTAFVANVIAKLGNLIANASGLRGKVSAIAVENSVMPILEALPKFTKAESDEDQMSGMVVAGTYDGTPILVAYTPTLAVGDMVGIYKSRKNPFLAPAVFGTFIPPITLEVRNPDNVAILHKEMIASAAAKVVAPRLASKINLTGITDLFGV